MEESTRMVEQIINCLRYNLFAKETVTEITFILSDLEQEKKLPRFISNEITLAGSIKAYLTETIPEKTTQFPVRVDMVYIPPQSTKHQKELPRTRISEEALQRIAVIVYDQHKHNNLKLLHKV